MDARVQQIVPKIRDDVVLNLPALVHRDRVLLTDVCRELGLAVDPVHMGQVATLMKMRGLTTHAEYPKWVYPDGPDKPGVLVADEAAERSLAPIKAPKISAVK